MAPTATTCAAPDTAGHQSWALQEWLDGTYGLKEQAEGFCLDDSPAYGLTTMPCYDSPFQRWTFATMNSGAVQVQNQKTGRCLDDSPAYGLQSMPCSAIALQSWQLNTAG